MWGKSLLTAGLVILASLPLWGCGADVTAPGEIPLAPTAHKLDAHRWLGEPVTVANLTVWPVHTDAPLDVGEFLTLGEAEGRGVARVHEVGSAPAGEAQVDAPAAQGAPHQEISVSEEILTPVSPPSPSPQQGIVQAQDVDVSQLAAQVRIQARQTGAQVNTLVIDNDSDLPILVCAGTIVKGGQQDRQIGQDFVIAAHTSVPVDAFCVEAGRWQARADAEGQLSFQFCSIGQGIAVKGVRSGAQYEQDQGKVWARVALVLEDVEVDGTTSLVAANEAVAEAVRAQRVAMEDAVTAHFARLAEGQGAPVGFAYAVDGKPVTVRAFAHERLLEGQLAAFVKAMCLEAELAERARPDDAPALPVASATDVIAMVHAIGQAEVKQQRTRAANTNAYRDAAEGYNGTCLVGADDGDQEITVDWTAK